MPANERWSQQHAHCLLQAHEKVTQQSSKDHNAWSKKPPKDMLLRLADMKPALKQKWLQLFWPEDKRWWPGQITDINTRSNLALLLYETGASRGIRSCQALQVCKSGVQCCALVQQWCCFCRALPALLVWVAVQCCVTAHVDPLSPPAPCCTFGNPREAVGCLWQSSAGPFGSQPSHQQGLGSLMLTMALPLSLGCCCGLLLLRAPVADGAHCSFADKE